MLLSKEVFEEISKNDSAGAAHSMPWRTSLVEYRDHSIPNSCFDTFFTHVGVVNVVNVHVKVDSANLIRFLKATKTVNILRLYNCSLDQAQFYEQLPLVTTIRILKILEGSTSIEFGFLLGMKSLSHLTLSHSKLPIQAVYRKLKMSWTFYRFDFYLSSDGKIGLTLQAVASERKSNYIRIKFCQDPYGENEEKVALDDLVSTLEKDERINKFLV